MGYYVYLEQSTVTLLSSKESEAFERLKALNDPTNDHLKRGGSFSGGKTNAVWYSWMDEDYDKTCKNITEIFDMLGFDTDRGDNGALKFTSYDSKRGQEDLFLEAIADLLTPGYMQWRGEDGEQWRVNFNGSDKPKTVPGTVTFEEPDPVVKKEPAPYTVEIVCEDKDGLVEYSRAKFRHWVPAEQYVRAMVEGSAIYVKGYITEGDRTFVLNNPRFQ